MNSFPSAAFNRYDYQGSGSVVFGLGYDLSYSQLVAQMFSEEALDANPTPSLASVDITGAFDSETRELKLTVAGNATEDFTTILGTQVGLTVYVLEDSLIARQYTNGRWIQNQVHNRVLRNVLSAVQGDAIGWNGDGTYTNTYTTTLNSAWNVDKMRVIAFIHRKGTGVNKEVINTEMVAINDLATVTPPVEGDVNGDGVVDIDDVNLVINMILTIKEKTAAADLNGDGNVDIDDMNIIINIMLR